MKMTISKLFQAYEIEMVSALECDYEKCDTPAQFVVSIHQINRCNEFGVTLSAHYLFCRNCFRYVKERVARSLRAQSNGSDVLFPQCGTCGKQFGTIDDVVSDSELIWHERW